MSWWFSLSSLFFFLIAGHSSISGILIWGFVEYKSVILIDVAWISSCCPNIYVLCTIEMVSSMQQSLISPVYSTYQSQMPTFCKRPEALGTSCFRLARFNLARTYNSWDLLTLALRSDSRQFHCFQQNGISCKSEVRVWWAVSDPQVLLCTWEFHTDSVLASGHRPSHLYCRSFCTFSRLHVTMCRAALLRLF